jgi:signal transduction histidine kinase
VARSSSTNRTAWERALTALALVVLGAWLVVAVQVVNEAGRTFPGFQLDPRGYVWSTTAPGWTGPAHGLRPFDHVLGAPAELRAATARLAPGVPVRYVVERAGQRLELTIPTQRYGASEALGAVLEGLVPAFFFWVVGLAAFRARPHDVAAQAFLVLELVLSMMVLLNVDYGLGQVFAGALVPVAYTLGGALLLVALAFPVAPAWLAQRPWAALAVLPLTVAATGLDRAFDAVRPYRHGTYLFAVFSGLCMAVLVGRLAWTAWGGARALDRARAQVVLFGLAAPCLAIPLNALTAAGVLPADVGVGLYHLSLAAVVCFPLSIAYAILVHRLFEIQVLLRRTVVYAGVVALLTALYFVTAALARLAVPTSGVLDEVLATATVTVLFVPVRDRLRELVQARFFRSAYDFKRTVAAFSERSQAELDVPRLTTAYLDAVEEALAPSFAGVVLVGDGTELRGSWPQPPAPGLALAQEPPPELPDAVLFPLSFQGEPLGAAVVGPRKSELELAEQDMLLLRTLSQQLAVRIRSAILYTQMESLVAERTAELRKAYDELKQLDELKAGFLNAVSHELRTPLAGMVGFLDALVEGDYGDLPAWEEPVLRKVLKGADQLTRLLDDLLDQARMEAGVFELEPTVLDLGALIRDVVAMAAALVQEKGHELELSLPADLPLVRADQGRVTQVLNNLISNAVKYTRAGGRLAVRARAEGAMVRVEVQDTGIGLSPEAQDKLFTRFFRVGGGEKGTGLGLSITKALVEAHGGAIGVESTLGVGSTFWFTLPRAPGLPGA